MIYGYIRVSSTDQNEARQRAALLGRGIPRSNIYIDTNIKVVCVSSRNINH